MLKTMPLSKRIRRGLLFGWMACLLFGCSNSNPPSNTEQKESANQSSVTADQVATVLPVQQLAGVWLGEAVMDEAKFQQKISQLTPNQQQLTLAKARSFLSMVMAVEFRKDGTVENGVEIVSTDGQVLRDSSAGNWRIVSAENNELLVEIQETLSDGTVDTDQNVYTFFPDGNRFAMAVPVSEELRGCNPMLVFQRKAIQRTDMAEGISETQSK
jgi:hypothetical protein